MKVLTILLVAILLLLVFHAQPHLASRPLHEEMNQKIVLQSLDRGSVPSSGGSGCTNIPGSSGPSCPLVNEMNFAGNALHQAASAAYPRLMVPVGVATNQN